MQVYLLWRRDNQQQEVAEEEGQELLPQPKAGAKVRWAEQTVVQEHLLPGWGLWWPRVGEWPHTAQVISGPAQVTWGGWPLGRWRVLWKR